MKYNCLIFLLVSEVSNYSQTNTGDDQSDANGDSPACMPQTTSGYPSLSTEVRHQSWTNITCHRVATKIFEGFGEALFK